MSNMKLGDKFEFNFNTMNKEMNEIDPEPELEPRSTPSSGKPSHYIH